MSGWNGSELRSKTGMHPHTLCKFVAFFSHPPSELHQVLLGFALICWIVSFNPAVLLDCYSLLIFLCDLLLICKCVRFIGLPVLTMPVHNPHFLFSVQCKKKHTLVCPDFSKHGVCPKGAQCKLLHPRRKHLTPQTSNTDSFPRECPAPQR